jgi:hypothetical protein
MKQLKHIGKMKNTGSKVLVVFRTLPGESNQALVLPVAQLPDQYHDSIMKLVEEDQAQEAFEFGEMMFIRRFPDGRPMLQAMQHDNRLHKVATDTVMMVPTPTNEIQLDELNVLIAEQRNCTVDDLYKFVKGAPNSTDAPKTVAEVSETPAPAADMAPTDGVLSDADLAKSLRSQADAMYKEAARMRREADELDPPKKKSTTKKKSEETASA